MTSTSGDGYVILPNGESRWGLYGAAGLLIRSRDLNGTERFLLVERSPFTHGGACWGIPGGALNHGETPADAASREFREEFTTDGPLTVTTEPLAVYADDHGPVTLPGGGTLLGDPLRGCSCCTGSGSPSGSLAFGATRPGETPHPSLSPCACGRLRPRGPVAETPPPTPRSMRTSGRSDRGTPPGRGESAPDAEPEPSPRLHPATPSPVPPHTGDSVPSDMGSPSGPRPDRTPPGKVTACSVCICDSYSCANTTTRWTYSTVILDATDTPAVTPASWEHTDAEWLTRAEIAEYPLHPAFAAALPTLYALIDGSPDA